MLASGKINQNKQIIFQEKGMVLYLVLTTLLIVIILSNVLLALVANQTRLTHHQVSRIQAYYASQAGLVWAFEQLRIHQKEPFGTTTWSQCGLTQNCTDIPYVDTAFPFTIRNQTVTISVYRPGGMATCPGAPNESGCVFASVSYTYSP